MSSLHNTFALPLLCGSMAYFIAMQLYTSSNYVFRQAFIEQDPGLSSPYVEPQVSIISLGSLSLCVPGVALIIAIIINSMDHKPVPFLPVNDERKDREEGLLAEPEPIHGPIYDPVSDQPSLTKYKKFDYGVLVICGLLISLFLTSGVTSTLKVLFGEPRPNFFALCNYRGYRDALNSGNFTDYFASTTFGRFGDPGACQVSDQEINNAFSSFPSGHSSLIFAGVTYASLILFAHRHRAMRCVHNLTIIVGSGLWIMGLWVSFTRVHDYYHRTYDVMAGILVGQALGYIIYVFTMDAVQRHKLSLKTRAKDYDSAKYEWWC